MRAPEPQLRQDKRRQGLTAVPPHLPLGGGHGQYAGDTKMGLQSENKVRETVGKP